MTRTFLLIGGATLWLVCFAIAMFTIIPLAAMGLAAIFDNGFTVLDRLQGLGFVILGLIAVTALFFTLTRMTRFLAKASRAQN